MDADRASWDQRHAARGLAAPRPPEAVADDERLTALLPTTGRALDLACGTGAQSSWLAARGLRVVALDVSPVAVELTAASASAIGCAERVDARVRDLDDGVPSDLGCFDVVLCQRFRDVDLYPSIVDLLAAGGIGIVTVLSTVGNTAGTSDFCASAGELRAAFAGTEVLAQCEADGVASIVFRRC